MTVVIPTRDRWHLLSANALPSALSQEDVHLEVIVVDDGSTDETADRLATLDDPRVRVIRHRTSQGLSQARNAGIAEARGEWLAFLDDDDLWSPRKLRTQLDAAAAQNASFVYCGVVVVDTQLIVRQTIPPPEPREVLRLLLRENAVPGGVSGVIARTDLVRHLDGFDENLSLVEDWDFCLRLAAAEPAGACQEVLVGYLLHPQNMSVVQSPNSFLQEFHYLAAKHRSLSLAHGLEFDPILFSRWVAMAPRRAGRRFQAGQVYLRSGLAQRNIGNLLRAVAVLALGDGSMKMGRRLHLAMSARGPTGERPAWLDTYRRD